MCPRGLGERQCIPLCGRRRTTLQAHHPASADCPPEAARTAAGSPGRSAWSTDNPEVDSAINISGQMPTNFRFSAGPRDPGRERALRGRVARSGLLVARRCAVNDRRPVR